MRRSVIKNISLVLFLWPLLAAGQSDFVEIKNLGLDQVKIAGFVLKNDKKVKIHCVGAGADKEIKKIRDYQEDPYNLFAYAWIVDAKSRDMVWRMTIDNSKGDWWDKWNREFDGNVSLKKGRYELYFSAIKPAMATGYLNLERIWDKVFGSEDWWEDHSKKWMVTIAGVDEALSEQQVLDYQEKYKDKAIISLSAIGDRDKVDKSFRVEKTINVKIYALGEGWRGDMFDYGWLTDNSTRQRVWEMRESKSSSAGGANKNRVFRESLTLHPGNYTLYYQTDDNHSHDFWNANPPYDPNFWGITIFASNPDYAPSVISEYKEDTPIVSITRVGDDAYEEEGLHVNYPGKFHIYALGEGRDGEMFDYGWITSASTGAKVWEMLYRHTEHAGGANKNRREDEVITLDKGDYIIHYRTDGSHSYEDWNSTPPYDPEKWGITVSGVGKTDAKRIPVDDLRPKNIIAQLIRIGDDENARKQFELTKTTRIRIYCIGEGDWDEMYDYGWIENERTGRKVWQMRYRNTENAGGAKKNRVANTVITLDPGVYSVHFVSDDSHSYREWNDSPPDDERMWGITLYNIDK